MSKETKTTEPVKQEGDFKLKKKRVPKKLTVPEETVKIDLAAVKKADEPIKVDLTKTENKDAVQEQKTEESVLRKEGSEMGLQEVGQAHEGTTENVIEEIPVTEEDKKKEVEQKVEETKPVEQPVKQLPENVEKLVSFMEETGGTVEDYVRLNADYETIDNEALLREYYKNTRPHLTYDEVNFLLEDNFKVDEEVDEEREVRKKNLAYKEEVGKAKSYLNDLKSKYYDEIKLRSNVNADQEKAINFFNRYNEDQKTLSQQREVFQKVTKDTFTDEFKGFDFKVGDKKFRYGVKNPNEIVEKQTDISPFVETFLDDKGMLVDPQGYHKAMYAARNSDTIAKHFYEQGKADATKELVAKTKNLSTEPRKEASGDVFVGGIKIKAISGADASKLRIKKRKFNN
jgi:hypothetical protein|tara:strand:- start:1046 stop:2245 length:1200 start_codon:yes stop_codon:yes gene_type:complete